MQRNFEHRRQWIQQRIRELSESFAVDIYAYAVMTNHLHIVLGTDPGRVAGWDDHEVARRWLVLFPGPAGKRGQPPEEEAIVGLCREQSRIAVCRQRLADVSWFMRCLNEPIARRANREDDCTGRFWEGRFKCQRLDDTGALVTCMAYVDLNPVRAGMALTPESSDFTSIQDRSVAYRAHRQLAAAPVPASSSPTAPQQALLEQAQTEARRASWLVPFGSAVANTPTTPAAGWLAGLHEEVYFKLLDWTGREIRDGKRGRIADDLRPVLQRMDLDVEAWTENVARYGSLFHRIAGKLTRLRGWATAKGQAWLQGHHGARLLYTQTT